jgi:alkaline phosphatase
MKKYPYLFLIFAFGLLTFQSCETKTAEPQVKYTFLFIGDGMGIAQVNTAEAYMAAMENKPGFKPLTFSGFPVLGWASTYANNRFITGSAAAGTALATGFKTNIGRISMNPDGTMPMTTIAEKSKSSGLKTGIITSVSIDHATPAAFYAHQKSRNQYFEIGLDLAASDMDYFGGGGFKKPVSVVAGDTINVFEKARQNGFTIANTLESFNALKPGVGKVIAIAPRLADGAALPYMIDGNEGNPSLADFTRKAIELLSDGSGFFIMVEGGKIDWACHGNDAASSLHETLAFDEAVAVALEFYNQHPDETLIVVTADHETGGLALGNAPMKYETDITLLGHQKLSSEVFNELVSDFRNTLTGDKESDFTRMMQLANDNFGIGDSNRIAITDKELLHFKSVFNESMYGQTEANPDVTYGEYEPLTGLFLRLVSQKSGLGWTSYSHTGINVPVYAIGPGAEVFAVVMDNTDIPKNIQKLMRLKE